MNPNSNTASLTTTGTKLCSKEHWKPSEDAKLKELVGWIGPQNWNLISEQLPGRSGKSCRMRWFNHLDPTINKQPFTEEEEFRLLAVQRDYGNKWAMISRHFQGRTDNALKNHWHIIMSRQAREGRQNMVFGRYSPGGSAFSTCTTELSLSPPCASNQPRVLNFSNTLAPGYNGEYVQRAEVNGLNGQKMDHQIHHKVAVSEGKVEMKKMENGFVFFDFLGVGDA